MKKCIVVCGQTATGKSDLAVDLALFLKKNDIPSEIISADSRQVYTGFDITSAKISKKSMRGILHHMLSICDPQQNYTVADYKKSAIKIIKDLHKKNIIPVICGGTGLYIDDLVFNKTIPEVKPNKTLREELEKLNTEDLFILLKNKDPLRAQNIDSKNKRRLIRALEIIEELGTVPKQSEPELIYNTLFIGLKLPNDVLQKNIQTRTKKRISGMIKEIKSLNKNGLSYKRLESFGMEYKWLSYYMQNKITKEECINGINKDTFKYAKRQITWFKRNRLIHWLDMSNPKEKSKKAQKLVLDFVFKEV